MKVKLLVFTLVTVMLLSLSTGCGGTKAPAGDKSGAAPGAAPGADSGDKAQVKQAQMKIAYMVGGKHPMHYEFTELKNRLNSKIGTQIKAEVYPSSQLGGPAQLLQGVISGTIESVPIPSSFFAGAIPEMSIIDLPGLFPSAEKAFQVLNFTSAADGIKKAAEAKGLIILGFYIEREKDILSTVPLDSKAAFKGKKIRTMAAPVLQDQINELGGVGVPIDTAEVYTALQQKTVEGVFSDLNFCTSMKLQELAKYRIEAPQGVQIIVLTVNKKWLESLPADVQKTIRETALEVLPVGAAYAKSLKEENLKVFADAGGKTIPVTPEFEADLKEMYKVVTDKFVQKNPQTKPIIEEIKAAVLK